MRNVNKFFALVAFAFAGAAATSAHADTTVIVEYGATYIQQGCNTCGSAARASAQPQKVTTQKVVAPAPAPRKPSKKVVAVQPAPVATVSAAPAAKDLDCLVDGSSGDWTFEWATDGNIKLNQKCKAHVTGAAIDRAIQQGKSGQKYARMPLTMKDGTVCPSRSAVMTVTFDQVKRKAIGHPFGKSCNPVRKG